GGGARRRGAGGGGRPGYVGRATAGPGADSQAGFTLEYRAPVVVEDLAAEKRFAPGPLLAEHGAASGVSVVIHGEGGPYGVLAAHPVRRRPLGEADAHLLPA